MTVIGIISLALGDFKFHVYQVVSHTNSIEALEAFYANHDKFDIVITDMAMPKMPGDKLSAELRKKNLIFRYCFTQDSAKQVFIMILLFLFMAYRFRKAYNLPELLLPWC